MGKLDTYSSFEEKAITFTHNVIDTSAKLKEFIDKWWDVDSHPNLEGFIFRGIGSAVFKLYNSAQRYWIQNELHILHNNIGELMKKMISAALGYQDCLLQNFYQSFNQKADDISVLSFLQHYGAPTPLIYFTGSFKNALYFSIRDQLRITGDNLNNFISVYVIKLEYDTPNLISLYEQKYSALAFKVEERGREVLLEYKPSVNLSDLITTQFTYIPGFMPNGIKYGFSNDYQIYNQNNFNIINQKGAFVFFCNASKPLEEVFQDLYKGKRKIICYDIHKSFIDYIIKQLRSNQPLPVDEQYIFPQEEDIARFAFLSVKQSI